MDLKERLSYLETIRDWQGLVDELEKRIAGGAAASEKAQYHLRLGQVLQQKFLAGVKALKHFQDAYKLSPAELESLEAARSIYWDLGKIGMVQKLCELELKSAKDGPKASALLLELGDVQCDVGDYDKATSTYARSLAASAGQNAEASACLEDVQAESGSWRAHVTQLLRAASDAIDPAAKSRLSLRAARVARRFAPGDADGYVEQAYRFDPTSKEAAALYEGQLVERGQLDALQRLQRELMDETPSRTERAALALTFGSRWVSRHQNLEVGTRFLEDAIQLDPSNEGAFQFLRDSYGRKGGDWERVLTIAEEAATHAGENGTASFLLAQAGTIAWKQIGNLIRARSSFERLSAVSPEHPQLRAFEMQIGETLKAGAARADSIPVSMDSVIPPVRRTRPPKADAPQPAAAPQPEPAPKARPVAEAPVAAPAPPVPATPAAPPVTPRVSPAADVPSPRLRAPSSPNLELATAPVAAAPVAHRAPSSPSLEAVSQAPLRVEVRRAEPSDERVTTPAAETPAAPPVAARGSIPDDGVNALRRSDIDLGPPPSAAAPISTGSSSGPADASKVAELRSLAARQEAAKRYNEYVRTLVQLAQRVSEPAEKISLFERAADIYANKFSNQAEAVKAYEAILSIDSENGPASSYLRVMYEKRRDWEKLLGLQRREAERLPAGPERAARFLEIAKLATERVKKPDVCIELWQEVLESDPSNTEALAALGNLYERNKDFDRLVQVLERQADATSDVGTKGQILSKLGTIYGDRLNNDAGAVEAWRALLALDPNDRKAQEALKKKYLALGRWDDLEVFYAETGKWDEFIRVLEQQEAKETRAESKIGLLFKTAELWSEKKQKSDRAAKAYEKVLELEPTNLRAAESLIPIYTATNNARALANAIEVKLGHEQDAGTKLSLLREVAALYEARVKDPQRAFERFGAAFELSPDDRQTANDLERAAKVAGAASGDAKSFWDRVIVSYERAIAGASGDRDLSIALRLRLGRVLVDEVARVDDALATYRSVYEEDGENADALGALERLYRQTSRYGELLGIYEKKRDLAVDRQEKTGILFEIARLYESEISDEGRAIETYNAVLDEEPRDARALAALDVLYGRLGRWEPYVETLRRRIDLDLGERDLIDLKYRLGTALETHLSDAAGALENYREILFIDAQHDGAREALERMLTRGEQRAEAAAILESIYEERGDWQKLIGALEILSEAEGSVEKRVEIQRKIARISSEQLGDQARAFTALAAALKDDPARVDTKNELERITGLSNAWTELMALYDAVAASVTDAQLAREYWMRLAAIDERLGGVDDAAKGYQRVLSLDPTDVEALTALETLYSRTERWTDLIGVIERRIEQTNASSAREALYIRMAEIYDGRLAQPNEAVVAYRKVLDLDPTSTPALSALDALFTRQKQWSDLADNLESQLSLTQDEDQQLALMLRLAALREGQMDQFDVAIEGYRAVLERDPTNAQALDALERLGTDPKHELVIADLLEPFYRHLGDHAKLIGVHEVQVRRAEDAGRRVELLHQIAQLHEEASGDLSAAFATFARALKEDPSHEGTQRQIDRVARATGRFADLAQTYESLAANLEEPAIASSLYTMAARVYEADLHDVDVAIALYRRVLEIDATNLGAAESLERLFRASERFADLSLVLQRKSEILEEPTEKKAALFQAAGIEEDVLNRPEAAIDAYKRVLEIDGDDLHALDALIQQYLALSKWPELLAVHSRKGDLVADPEEKKRIFYQVGAVYEHELGDVPQSIETYQKILELDPDDLQALSRLDVLYEQAQNWNELLTVLTREAEMTGDPNEAVSFQYRIAELYEKHLGDVPRAVELYRDILTHAPDDEPTLRALEGLKGGDKDPLGAAAVLEPIYEAASDWTRLISVHEVQVQHASDPYQRVDLLHRVARLYEEALGQPAAAFETYARALSLDNGNETTLQNLERLAGAVGRWPEVAALYDAELDREGVSPERLVELGLRAAQIFETQLDDVDSAILRYRRVIEVDAENQNAIRSLDRLFTQTERWSDLASVLAREAEIGTNGDEVIDFKYRLGQVYETRLRDLDAALAAYREVLVSAPDHAPTLDAIEALFAAGTKQVEISDILEPLYRQAGDWEKLVGVHQAQLAHTQGEAERRAAYIRIAELTEEKLLDGAATLDVYIRLLKEYPLDEKAGEEAPRLAASVEGGWETLANAYADVLGMHSDVGVQAAVGKRLAKTFEDELGDITKSEETYKYVLGVDPLDTEALANLDRIYLSIEAWPELAGVLEQRVKATEDTLELVELYARLGEVYETRLNDTDNAIRAYRTIFDGLERNNDQATQALARIYQGLEKWGELNTVYERELESASGDAVEAEIRAKIAALASERLSDPVRAISTWKQVLDLRGEDVEALLALTSLYEGQHAWSELVEVLERRVDVAEADDDRVNLLTRRARVFSEKLSRDALALEDWGRVLDIDYANLAALRSIVAIRRRQEDAGELVSGLHQLVDRAATLLDEEQLKDVYRELGKTYGEQLGQPFEAAEAWRKLLEVGPDFEAMDALEAIYRNEERWPEAIDVKMQRAAFLGEPETQIEEYRSIAALWQKQVGESDASTVAWQKILEVDASHDEAFQQLEKLHTAAGRWEPLIELYLARLDTRTETSERTELLRKIAHVFEEQLGDKNQALDALINALGEDFHDRETARYLDRMAQATGRWGEVIQIANNWLEEQTEPAQKIRLCLHLAKWYGDDLGHPEYAQPYYAEIVKLDPNNVGALRQMGQLYRKSANWTQLGATLTRALDVAITDLDRKEILSELGELLDEHMSQTDQAIGYFNRALEVDGQFLPALDSLERIYGARGQNRDLVDVMTRKVSALDDPADVIATKLRIASLHETNLTDPAKAASVYREVADADPANIQALRGLARVYETLQSWSDLVRVLESELDVVQTERARIEVLMQLAGLQEEHFLKPDVAAQRLEQVLEIDPNNEEAYFALERNYRKLRQWLDLINSYDRHVAATSDRKTKVDIYAAIAQVYADEVEDNERAVDAYKNIVDLDDTNVPALEALAKLYDKLGDAGQTIEYMTRVAELTTDSKQRVESFYRIGKALDEKVGDRVAAQDRYEMALDLDPSHVPTLAALRQIAVDSADYDKAAQYLDQEQRHTTSARQRARLLVELGRIREEMLGDHEAAVLAWQSAHEADGENEDAALPLAVDSIAKEAWAKAEPLLDLLTRKAGKRDRAEQHDLWNKLGLVTAKQEKDEKALKAYTAAHQLDLMDQVTIRGLAEVTFRLKDWGAALTNFQKVLTSLGDADRDERANVYFKLGCIKREQGQTKQAINNFEKALSVDGAHRPTLEALVSLYTDLKDWKQVVAYKRLVLDNVVEGEERFRILNEIGDIWNDNDKSPLKAIEPLEEALELQPENLPLLHKLLTLYQATENWGKMIDTIQAIASLDKDPIRKSKFLYTMAQLYRDKEQDQDRAVELFNEALDLNPTFLEAFERINKILTTQRDWKALERAFRKMLRRLSQAGSQSADLEFNLWHNLGIIYRDRLQDNASAIEAFKMATRYKPDEAVERQILAELYEVTGQMESAVGEHALVLQKDPMKVEPYRALYRLYAKAQEYDRAWCMCAALAFLRKADEGEQQFFEEYRSKGMIQVKSRLDNELWVRQLFHKDENLYIGKIFEMITPAAIVAKTNQLRAARQLPALEKRFKQDPATSTVTFAKTFGWAAQVLAVPTPELYVRNDVPGALVAVPSAPPASVAGQTVLTGFSPQELTFIVGKHLSYYRGEHYIRNLFPTLNELKVLLFAAIKMVVSDFAVPAEMAQAVHTTATELVKNMQPIQRDGLRLVVQKFMEDGAKADLKRWMQAIELTGCRAGLLLCADLEIAKKIIAAEPQNPGDLPPQEKMKELLIFSTSEPYFALRRALGIAVG